MHQCFSSWEILSEESNMCLCTEQLRSLHLHIPVITLRLPLVCYCQAILGISSTHAC